MDLEKIATSAIVSSISKTDTLSGFINDGDKEPCWDGNIYIHENSRHSKKNIKRIKTTIHIDVKGTLREQIKGFEFIQAVYANNGYEIENTHRIE